MLTSTGKGHEFRKSLVFPPVDFKRTVTQPLPPLYQNNKTSPDNLYITTTGAAHNFKPTNTILQNDPHKKAPGHWNVKYTADTIFKLQVNPQRQPLTMSNQESEMRSQYKGKPVVSLETFHASDHQPQIYRHHHTDGPLKKLNPSKDGLINSKRYPLQDKGVFDYHGEMYLTTTHKDHRTFSSEELTSYPKKEYSTFWECENYPKAWGHGSNKNPLPTDSVARETGPMRDTLVFKSATTIPRIPKRSKQIPNTGSTSEVRANYKNIHPLQRDELFHCPVPKPRTDGNEHPQRYDFGLAPKMYKSEYNNIGNGKPVTV